MVVGERPLGPDAHLPRLLQDADDDARDEALMETGLADQALPAANPYSWDEIMNRPIPWDGAP